MNNKEADEMRLVTSANLGSRTNKNVIYGAKADERWFPIFHESFPLIMSYHLKQRLLIPRRIINQIRFLSIHLKKRLPSDTTIHFQVTLLGF